MELLDQILTECRHVEPRDYQRRIVTKAANMLTGRHVGRQGVEPVVSSVLIESPTGSGKTCMAMLALKLLQQEIPDLHIGWIAMRRELLHQAAREHEQTRTGVAHAAENHARHFGGAAEKIRIGDEDHGAGAYADRAVGARAQRRAAREATARAGGAPRHDAEVQVGHERGQRSMQAEAHAPRIGNLLV